MLSSPPSADQGPTPKLGVAGGGKSQPFLGPGTASGGRVPGTDESRQSRQRASSSHVCNSSAGAFSFGGQRLGLRTRTLLDHSPGGGHSTPSLPFPGQTSAATAAAASSPVPYETPVLFGMRVPRPHAGAKPAPPCFNIPAATTATNTANTAGASSCQSVWVDHMLVANILQWLEPPELHQVTQLGLICRAARAALPLVPITDLDFSWRGRTYTEGEESAEAIRAALASLSSVQKQSVQRLVTSPDLLACPTTCLHMLSDCPALAFLILTLQGSADDMFAAVADHWPELDRLTSRLPHLVCLDASACLMQDAHLQAVADHCPGLRALDLSYNPLLTGQGVALLLAACPHLEELDLSTCPAAQGKQVLEALGRHCPLLTTLYLEHDPSGLDTSRVTSAGLHLEHTFSTAHLTHLVGCTQLQLLSLAGQQDAPGSSPLPGPSPLQQLLTSCPQLHTLNLARCSCLTAADLHALAAGPHSLVQLQLEAGRVDDCMLGQLARGAAGLRVCHLDAAQHVTQQGLTDLIQVCTCLVELRLTGVGEAVLDLTTTRQALRSRPDLVCVINGQAVEQSDELQEEEEGQVVAGVAASSTGAQGVRELRDCTNTQVPGGGVAGRAGGKPGEGEAAGGGKPTQQWNTLLSFLSQQVDNIQL